MSQALYRKWRPSRFGDVQGQEHVTQTLRNSIIADRVGHAYLFCGPRGTGKTTSARLLAKAINCHASDLAERPCGTCPPCIAISENRYLDLIEIDAASNTGVDDIRDLRDKINFSPSQGRFKVYIIDEVHMLSTAAFNALLKTVEEPPPHAKFILATTEEHKVPATIKSRCQQFNFRLLTLKEIKERLLWLTQQESVSIEPEAINLIAAQGAGSLRDAESLLDQLVTSPGELITLAQTQSVLGVASNETVFLLTKAWIQGDGNAGLTIIYDALASGSDARQFARQMVTYLRDLLLLKTAGPQLQLDLPTEQKEAMLQLVKTINRSALIRAVRSFNEAATTNSHSWQPQLPLELAFIDLLSDAPSPSYSEPIAATKAAPQLIPTPTPTKTPIPKSIPTPTPPSQPTIANVPNSSSALTLSHLNSAWEDIQNEVAKEDKMLSALLKSNCRPLAIEGEKTIVLGFDYPALKAKFDRKQTAVAHLLNAVATILHVQAELNVTMTNEYTPVNTSLSNQFNHLANELGGHVKNKK